MILVKIRVPFLKILIKYRVYQIAIFRARKPSKDMVALNLTNRARKDAGPLGGLREQYEEVRGKVGELDNIGNLGAQLGFKTYKESSKEISSKGVLNPHTAII